MTHQCKQVINMQYSDSGAGACLPGMYKSLDLILSTINNNNLILIYNIYSFDYLFLKRKIIEHQQCSFQVWTLELPLQ